MRQRMNPGGLWARKALHATLIAAFAISIGWWGRWPVLGAASLALVLMLGGEWLRARSPLFERTLLGLLGPLMTHDERRKSRKMRLNGATWAMIAIVATILLFPPRIAAAALLILAIGDPAAALVGTWYGRIRLGGKSLEGALAFFFASLLAVMLLAPLPFTVVVVACAIAAVVEILPLPGCDNVRIPLAAGAAMVLVLWLF